MVLSICPEVSKACDKISPELTCPMHTCVYSVNLCQKKHIKLKLSVVSLLLSTCLLLENAHFLLLSVSILL